MHRDSVVQERLVRLGGAAGLIGCLMYAVRNFPVPGLLQTPLFIFFGPVLVVAYVGTFPFMARPRLTVSALLGSVFGIIGAATNMMFAVVQLNNLHYIRGYIASAASDVEREQWRLILQGVFTVQNGLNYVSDFFFDWTIFLWAILMWDHPKFGKVFTISGIIAGGLHFGMKLASFPEPPSEAGLFDAGPLIGVWYAIVSIQVLRHVKWMRQPVPPQPAGD
jgi:hypothetical protein